MILGRSLQKIAAVSPRDSDEFSLKGCNSRAAREGDISPGPQIGLTVPSE